MAVISKDLGAVTAYAAAVNRGYTGTKEEFETLMASYATVAQQAAQSASDASQSAQSASQSAQNAETAQGMAQQAATDAQTAQESAQGYAQSAQQSAQSASQSAQSAESAKNTAVDAVDGFAAGAQQALDGVNQAGNNWKSLAERQAENSEAYALGTRDGEDVGTSDPAYHNNAKWYAEQGGAEVTAAQQARQGAEAAQSLAETARGKAEEAQTAAETAQTKAEEAAERADVKSDGTYDNMTAGSAKQIISSKYTVETEPYTFRASGGDGADREYDEIIGGSVVCNQLIQNGNFADGADGWLAHNSGADLSVEDGVATVTLNTIASSPNSYTPALHCMINGKVGHVYLSDLYAMPSKADSNTYVYFGGNIIKNYRTILTANIWTRVVTLTKPDSLSGEYILDYLGISNPNVIGYEAGDFIRFRNIQIYDLTQMFGSTIADHIYNLEQTTAGAGVAWFREYFPKDYYEYNPGELMHVSDLQSHDMVGFNAWDEEWEVGAFNTTTGANMNNETVNKQIRSKNLIPIIGGQSYYVGVPSSLPKWSDGMWIMFFDADKNIITSGLPSADGTSGNSKLYNNRVFVAPDNACYIKFYMTGRYTGGYNHDICINLSGDGKRNGEYEPYVKHSYPLDSSLTLRGIPKLSTDGKLYYDGDHYKADGTVERRYLEVKFGPDLTTSPGVWFDHDSNLNTWGFFYNYGGTTIPPMINGYTPSVSDKFIWSRSSVYTTDAPYIFSPTYTTAPNGYIGFRIPKTAIETPSDATDLRNKILAWINANPFSFIVELATPTTETADPYQSLQITDPYGTEEYVTTGIVPVGHETKYPENLRAKIEGLPWDFSSLIAPTENGTASRNYTVGSLLIMNNTLYKVTANIANGGAITPNTNVTATTLSEIISALA